MNIQDKLTFFHALEEKIWKEQVESNQYFGTLSILIVALSGALVGGGNFIADNTDWNVQVSMIGSIGACFYLWGLNVAESIFASKNVKTAILRSLLFLAVMAVAFVIGFIAAVIVIIIVMVIAAILFFLFTISLFAGSGKTYTLRNTSTGEEVKVKDNGIFGHSSGSGRRFEKNPDDSWSEK